LLVLNIKLPHKSSRARDHFRYFIFIYTIIFIHTPHSHVCTAYLSNERSFLLSLASRGHVYKFKSARDKRINIDADEAKSRNTVTTESQSPSGNFTRAALIPARPTLRPPPSPRSISDGHFFFSARFFKGRRRPMNREEGKFGK